MSLDHFDITILNALQENARIGVETLAQKTSLSTASVQRRLKKLRESGIIAREVALIDPSKLGKFMTFVVLVELERERQDQVDQFFRRVSKEPQVQQCYYVTGDADFCLICVARDMEDFETLTQRLFFEDSNVRRFRTSVVMGRQKTGTQIFLTNEDE